MEYRPTHYVGDKTSRFLLGTLGKRNALFLAVNPSLADATRSDTTITKISRFAERNGYDGWFVANIYPQRSTDPKGIHIEPDQKLLQENIKTLSGFVRRYQPSAMVACWGNLIFTRPYLQPALQDLVTQTNLGDLPWFCISLTKKGIPAHPSRVAYGKFKPFRLF